MKSAPVTNKSDLIHKKIVTGYLKLKQRENYIEKTNPLPKLLDKLSKEDSKANELINLYTKRQVDRKAQTDGTLSILDDLRDSFERLKLNIDEEHLKKNDLQYYKNSVLDIENRFSSFKQKNLIELETLQGCLDYDRKVATLERLMNKSLRAIKSSSSTGHVVARAKPDNINICEESKIFHKFLDTHGGHTGGWPEEDHSAYLRIKSKTKDVTTLVKAIQSQMPDLSEEVILQHKDWHNKYEHLKEMQSAAIKKWREGRILIRSKTTVTPKLPKPKSAQSQKSAVERPRSASLPDRELIKKQIEIWKSQKQEKQKEQEEKLIKELKSLKNKEYYEKMYHTMKKEQLVKWQEEKRTAAQEKVAQKEVEEMKKGQIRANANKILCEFRAQDEALIQKKIQMFKNARPKVSIGTIPLGGPTVSAQGFRDPNRLFRPTESTRRRTNYQDAVEDIQKKDINRNMSVRNIPKLGIPLWRLNMNKA